MLWSTSNAEAAIGLLWSWKHCTQHVHESWSVFTAVDCYYF